MKKILSILGIVSLTATTASNVVACAQTRLATDEEIADRVLFTYQSFTNGSDKKTTFPIDKLQYKDYYIKKLTELIPTEITDDINDRVEVKNGFHINYENFDKTKVSIYNDENTPEDFYWLKNQINFYVQYNKFKNIKKPIQITINRKLDIKDIPTIIDLGTIKSPNDKPTKDELINEIIEKNNENNFIKNWLINDDNIYNIDSNINKTNALIIFKYYFPFGEIEKMIQLIYKMTK